jgi:uroporphyrinogen-III decarboxylase
MAADAAEARSRGKAVIAWVSCSFGGAASILGPGLKEPKGIRSAEELLVSLLTRQSYMRTVFEAQADILISNLDRVSRRLGDLVDIVFYCGTDFGTQKGPFFSPKIFRDLYVPVYSRINGWVHSHTPWKIFKHTCGAVAEFIPLFIESGFDILNPIQYSAAGMDPKALKKTYGRDIVFWGGGVDTQDVLPFRTPGEVRREVLTQCELLFKDGGFVFAAVHNIQAKTPTANLIAMLDALREFNGSG